MKKSKSSKSGDRLSNLPESVIFHIFWLLPMRDVVRTTILSTHWKNLWTTMPCLNFDCEQDDDIDIFRGFVNRALIFWRGIKIQKFKIKLCSDLRQPLISDIDMWVRFAKDNEVEELYLHQMDYCETYLVPPYLFSSCSSLKVLSLRGCSFQVRGNVQWNQLKSLTIHGDLSDDEINQVLSGSPQLEVFFLHLEEQNEDISIRSNSLKKLSIYSYSLDFTMNKDVEVSIWTPSLETLEISGIPYRCLLKNVSSLTHATLKFHPDPADVFGRDDFLEETLRQIFPTIQHVENVTLSNWCIEVAMKSKCLLPTLWNAKFLKVDVRFTEHEQIATLFGSFPKLEMLELESASMRLHLSDDRETLKFDAKSYLEFQTNIPNSFLQQLRTVKVTWTEGDNSIFPVIQIVLKYASKLETMVLRVRVPASSKSLLLVSQKLLRMQRSSPTAELIFCE